MITRRLLRSVPLLLFLFVGSLGLMANLFVIHNSLFFPPDPFADFPIFGKNGGVAVFYHIPRTGGTSIRLNMKPAVPFFRVVGPDDWDDAEEGIRLVLRKKNGSKKKILIELHGDIPGLAELHERVQHWRKLSEISGIPLFTFTLVRDPVSFTRSYFQLFHHPNCTQYWCERDTYPQTTEEMFNENLLQTVIPNHQCKLLLLGQREDKKQTPRGPNVTTEQCENELIPLLEQDWDWVGRMETVQTEALPILTRIFLNDASWGLDMINHNPSRKYNAQLYTDTIDEIMRQSPFDAALHGRICREKWRRKKH